MNTLIVSVLGSRHRRHSPREEAPPSGEFRACAGVFPVSAPVSVRPVARGVSRQGHGAGTVVRDLVDDADAPSSSRGGRR